MHIIRISNQAVYAVYFLPHIFIFIL